MPNLTDNRPMGEWMTLGVDRIAQRRRGFVEAYPGAYGPGTKTARQPCA
jgi:hypothetical protein